ncbi:MAG: phage tail length tape measure family protein, partial [Microvirga sp.]
MAETATAVKQLGAGIDGLVVTQENLSRTQIRLNAQLDATAKKYDQEYRAVTEVIRVQNLLDRARSQGLSGTEAYARIQGVLADKLAAVGAAAKAAADAQQQLANASRTQTIVNTSTGAGQTFNTAGRAEDVEAYGKSLDELQAKFDPLFAAQQQYRAEVLAISEAQKVGALSQQQAAKAVDTATNRYNNQRIEIGKSEEANARLAKGVGLNAYAWQNLSFQVNDVVTSLASGISPFQTLAQQGGQIYQILQQGQGGVGGALKGIAERLLAINPLVGVFGLLAAGAAVAAVTLNNFAKAQRDVQLALLGAGQGAGVSADQIQKIAEQASATSTITVAAARDIEKAFLESGKVYGDVFAKGITAADDFAKKTGSTPVEAAKMLAGALADLGGGGFDDLAKKAGNFDVAFEKTVKDAINRGNDLEAQRLVIDRFAEAFDKASTKATGLQSVLQRADQIFKNAAESAGKAISQRISGPSVADQLEEATRARDVVIKAQKAADVVPDTTSQDEKIRKLTA